MLLKPREAIDLKLVTPEGADDIFFTHLYDLLLGVLVCFGVIGLPHTAVRCISYMTVKVHRGIIIGTIVAWRY